MRKLLNFVFYLIFNIIFLFKPAISEEKIKIGLLLPLTGQNSDIGKSVLRSVSLAINQIDNSQLQIYPKDNYGNPDNNFLAAKELYNDGVKIFIGPIFEKNLGDLEKLDDAIFLTLSNKINSKKNNIIYSGVNAYSQIDAIKKFLKKNEIKKTICLIPKSNFKNEIEKGIAKANIKFENVYYYDTKPTEITKRIEKITNYSIRKQNVLDEIKRLEKSNDPNKEKKIAFFEKKDTIGKLKFDSVLISDFDETLKSVATSLIYTDVSSEDIFFITLNQWFDESLLGEFGAQNLYFTSENKKIYYLAKQNDNNLPSALFDKLTLFKGKTGLFEIENKSIKHILNFYKVENKSFKKIF